VSFFFGGGGFLPRTMTFGPNTLVAGDHLFTFSSVVFSMRIDFTPTVNLPSLTLGLGYTPPPP